MKGPEPRQPATGSSDDLNPSKRIDKLIADLGDWRGDWLVEIRRIIHEVDPEVVEDWKWRGTPIWSHEGMYANVNAFKDRVKLTFFHGAQLSYPNNVFNAGLLRKQFSGDRHPYRRDCSQGAPAGGVCL